MTGYPCDQFFPGFAPVPGGGSPDPDMGGGGGPPPEVCPDPDEIWCRCNSTIGCTNCITVSPCDEDYPPFGHFNQTDCGNPGICELGWRCVAQICTLGWGSSPTFPNSTCGFTCSPNWQCISQGSPCVEANCNPADNDCYDNESECNINCVPTPPPDTYLCNESDFTCSISTCSPGIDPGCFSLLSDCESNCIPPVIGYTCVDQGGGVFDCEIGCDVNTDPACFATQAACICNCTVGLPGWACTSPGFCEFCPGWPDGTDVFPDQATCLQNCLVTEPGYMCINNTCVFGNYDPNDPGYFVDRKDCFYSPCNVVGRVSSNLLSESDPDGCIGKGLREEASDEHQFSLWCNKINKGISTLIYTGTNNKIINSRGSNCPRGTVMRTDGDGCRYCSPITNEKIHQQPRVKLGHSIDRYGMAEGIPGTQGNCSEGYLIEISDSNRLWKKCIPFGSNKTKNYLGTQWESSISKFVFDIDKAFGEPSRSDISSFIKKGKPIVSEIRKFKKDKTYNLFTTRPNSKFTLVSNSNIDLFDKRIYSGIKDLLTQQDKTVFNSTLPSEITEARIKSSINKKEQKVINSYTDSLGRLISPNSIYSGIKRHLLLDNIQYFKKQDLHDLKKLLPKPNDSFKYLEGLNVTLEEIIAYAIERGLPVDPYAKGWSLTQTKRIENIYIPPPELFENMPIVSSLNGNTYDVSVGNDQRFFVTTSGGGVVQVALNFDHSITVLTSDGKITKVRTKNNLDDSFMLRNFDRSRIIHWILEHVPLYTLRVESLSTEYVEFTYASGVSVPAYQVLELVPSTIGYYIQNDVIKTSSALYSYQANASSTGSQFNNNIKHRAGPWLNLTLDYRDPILEYIRHKDTSSVILTHRSFSLLNFGSEYGETSFVSLIPYFIIITPTNKFTRNPFGLMSKLINYYTRELNIDFGITKSDIRPGLSTPLNSAYSINLGNKNIFGSVDSQAIEFYFDGTTKLVSPVTNFIDGIIPVRKALGIRRYYELLKNLKDNYIVINNSVSNFDLFSRFLPHEYFSLFISSDEELSNITKKIEDILSISVVDIAEKDLVKSKLGEVSIIELPTYTTPATYPYSIDKEDF